MGKLLNTVKIVQSRLNPELAIEGILLTMYDERLRLSNQVAAEVKTHFGKKVFNTVIQRNSNLKLKSSGDYQNLAIEILKNLN